MDAYRVDAGDILHDLGASVAMHDELVLGEILYDDIVFTFERPAIVDALISNAGAGLVVTGTVSATLRTECARCLESFAFTLDATLEGFYTTTDRSADLPEDQEWEPIQDDAIDILPAVLAAIRIELPIAPLHDLECAGICPTCGCNRNESICECTAEKRGAGPFDALKSLLDDSKAGK